MESEVPDAPLPQPPQPPVENAGGFGGLESGLPDVGVDAVAEASLETPGVAAPLVDASASLKDSRMIQLALAQGWEIPEEYRPRLVMGQIDIALSPLNSPRDRTSAFKALATVARTNVEIAKTVIGSTPKELNVNHSGAVGIAALRQELLNDHGYNDYLRDRQLQQDAGALCGADESALAETVAAGQTSVDS